MATRRTFSPGVPKEKTVRASISFPETHYAQLERIAQNQRVSLAWVVREAVQSYIAGRWPLLENSPHETNAGNSTR